MTINVYLDVYFGFNFLMDMSVLYITGEMVKNSKSIVRTILAAFFGAIYATNMLLKNQNGVWGYILTYIVVAQLMVLIAFGYLNIRDNFIKMAGLYISTFLLNGIINLLGINAKLCNVIFLTIIVSLSAKKAFIFIRKQRRVSIAVKVAKIYCGNKVIKVMALVDTGNSLYEPFTKKPVSVIEKGEVEKNNLENMKIIYVPFNSIGEKSGLLKAVIADKMEVDRQIIERPVIGIFDGKLSRRNEYKMILHPDILGKENEYDSKLF